VAQQSLGGSGGRWQLLTDGVGIWLSHPLLGVGPGNNYPYMLRYSTLATPHNQYVNLLMELGIIGFACFACFAFYAARMGLDTWRTTRHPRRRQLVLAWLGVFGGMMAGGVFGDFVLPSIRNAGLELFALYYVQWVLLGLLVSIHALERTPHPQPGLTWRH
jgi:O-antigen ligase